MADRVKGEPAAEQAACRAALWVTPALGVAAGALVRARPATAAQVELVRAEAWGPQVMPVRAVVARDPQATAERAAAVRVAARLQEAVAEVKVAQQLRRPLRAAGEPARRNRGSTIRQRWC